jgi:hypothetical protein
MANFHAFTRSNYFRVKDAGAFKAWCNKRSLEAWTKPIEGMDACYAFTADTGECRGWPSYDGDDCEIDFTAELAEHLDRRDVAVLFEVGANRHRYIIGQATAINADGRTILINIRDIYGAAAEAFGQDLNITEARY